MLLKKLFHQLMSYKVLKVSLFYFQIIICCFLFILTLNVQRSNEFTNEIKGVMSQIQMMLSIYLVLSSKKLGYILSLTINYILIFIASLVFIGGNFSVLPGIIIPIISIIVITLLYKYYTKLNIKIAEVLDNEKRLDYLANYDYLTDLPNRKLILDKIQTLINTKQKTGDTFAVVFIDVDNFKNINDTLGYEAGDFALKTLSSNFKKIIHPKDILGRLGGDEFALIIEDFRDESDINSYLEKIKDSLDKTFSRDNLKYRINASYGVSIYPKDGDTVIDLLKTSDAAMYKAKDLGNNSIKFFTEEMREEILKKLSIGHHLKQAINNNEIHLVFQPQYGAKNKKLKGFETLVRWNSKELGFVSPLEFIKIAEENGFIIPLGYWIIDKSLKSLKKWKDKYNLDIKLSINISAVQIMDMDFIKNMENLLKSNSINGQDIILEITESVCISSMDYVLNILNQLKSLGISIALDDFGTGYSSLSYLKSLPINLLKIDKSFIDDIHKGNEKNALVGSIIQLSKSIGISVVAEGVEISEQLEYLKAHNCDYIQGYLWGRPLIEGDVEKLLEEEKSKIAP